MTRWLRFCGATGNNRTDHTLKCWKYLRHWEQRIAEYDAAWPNHCTKCHGRGELVGYDAVPYGSTVAMLPSYEPCEACGGKCPRCGVDLYEALPYSILVDYVLEELDRECRIALQNGYYMKTWFMDYLDKEAIWWENQLPCPACGWDWGENSDDYRPEEPECYCWEREDYPSVYDEYADLYLLEEG